MNRRLLLSLITLLAPVAASGQFDPTAQQQRELQRQEKFNQLQQLELDNRIRANDQVPIGQRALLDYGVYITAQYLSLDDRAHDNHGLTQYDIVPYARLNIDAANELFIRGRFSYQAFNPGDSFQNRGDQWHNDLDRGYYRFDLAKAEGAYEGKRIPFDVTIQAGRDLVYWANGLVLGSVLDGAVIDLSWNKVSLQVITGITPTRTVDIDSSRPDFDFNTRRGFYGAMLTASMLGQRPFIYALSQRDWNPRNDLALGNIHTHYAYNSYYLGAGSSGSITDHLVYGAEAVYEGGHTLSNGYEVTFSGLQPVPQTRDQISAAAADFRLDYLPGDSRNSRFSFETILASGDPDRGQANNTFNGNRPNTRDIGFNGFGLVNTGLAFSPEVSNLLALRLGMATYPFPNHGALRRLQVGTDLFI